jgi:3-hydroxybutyryl-CoA dehydrogenase
MFDTVSVFGAGTMGHGIAQVCAQAGSRVWLHDVDQARVDAGLAQIKKSLDKGVEKGKVTAEVREATLGRIRGTTDEVIAASEGELLVEAIPEDLTLKQALFRKLDSHAEEGTVFATNTSSLSVAKIAEAVSDPSRVIGTHFFNPVPIMTLLEIVFHTTTANEVIDAIREYGARLGKECIVVKDVPGFATSRLGVCLGMEAIRMLEAGVASAEDIDKAMVLGYRHPIGPLRLTDMVGLDVRLAIGSYLAKELNSAAFEPPALMRRMVQEGKLGQKSGEGFYRWS